MKEDWHKADIIAALRKCGTSLAALSRAFGLSPTTLSNTLHRPWPKGEKVIAEVIGVPAAEIWSSHYYDYTGGPKAEKRESQGRLSAAAVAAAT
ncbi:MAG: helix-turn-helix domain-containing protein [Sodalis sp. (in: enterobacteria)]|uniref:helix-turn-helix domain-containing protein n=1 Tax=Sodalis sp. (in: enterobacteria) TaxID=1898979 RepID=UPI003F3CE2EC